MESLLADIVAPENNSNDEVKSKSEEDAEPHKCTTCSRTFSAKRDLVTHQYMHRENQKVSCSECSKVFMTESGLRKHMHTHKKKKTGAKAKVAAPKRRKDYTCRQCNAIFDTKKQLGLHHNAKHVDEKRFVCEICSSQFAWPENLRAHKQSHEVNPHECNKCGRRFVDATSLRVHTRNSHGPNSLKTEQRKGFSCGICGRAFQFDFSLRAHMKGHAQAPSNAQQHAQNAEQPCYVHMNQEGIIDLQSQNENNANEIIIEVYNYDTSQTENHQSIQEPHDVALKDEEHENQKKNQDWALDRAQPGLELKNEDTATRGDTMQNGSVTSALNPVSIDESGMCITVSAEALPSLLGMDTKKPSVAQFQSSVVEESKESEGQSNVCYTRNSQLIWYEPPIQTTDDQNAMIVWYQQPQSAPVEDSYGWSQEENQGSHEIQKQDIPLAAAEDAKENVLEKDEDAMRSEKQRAPMKQVADTHNVQCEVKTPPVPRLRGRKSRPREPFLFNCVMTDEKPFVCLYCNEAFRWEISLNVHLRKHNIGHEVASTFLARGGRGGKTRGTPRGPTRGRTGVRVQIRPLMKNVSAVKSKSPVGRSRIVPRTASSDEEDEYDEYSFHGEPDEEPVPHKAGTRSRRASTEGKKGNSNGRGRSSGVRARGFGPGKRGNSSRMESDSRCTIDDVSATTKAQYQHVSIEPTNIASTGVDSTCEEHPRATLSVTNNTPPINNNLLNNLADDKLQEVSETQVVLPCFLNSSNPSGSPLNLTSNLPNAESSSMSMNRNNDVNSSTIVKTFTKAQNGWLKCQRSNLRMYSSCPICKRLLTTLDAVHRHRRSHLCSRYRTIRKRPLACNSCSVSCSSRLDLLRHQRLCGSPEGSRCNVCHRVFTSLLKRDSHRQNHFSKVKPSRCFVCDKRFFDAAKCEIHQSSHVI